VSTVAVASHGTRPTWSCTHASQLAAYVIDEPADLPKGSVVELVAIDDVMDPAERAALDASMARGLDEAARGLAIPADEALRQLKDTNARSTLDATRQHHARRQ